MGDGDHGPGSLEKLIGGAVIRVLRQAAVGDEFWVDADDIGKNLWFEASLVVLAKACKSWAKVAVEFQFIFAHLREGFGKVEGPGHFAAGTEAGEAILQGAVDLGLKVLDHFAGLKNAVAEVALFAGENLQPAALLGGLGIDAVVRQARENGGNAIIVRDVEDTFVFFEAVTYKRADVTELFFTCFEDERDVITGVNRP